MANAQLLPKFETKSNRVKGLSFHPWRPWILASLHNGVIQLWDYRIRTLLERFEEHEGPVRGVDFHHTQPLFVSGGDDYKIKVWNYKLRKCIFTLLGHLDYIRTVKFHHDQPWILSASDDQTIRIWNWQSRQCVSILTGHNHYVMCANFHPKEDLVVSASLDQTIRVWDVSGLRKSSVTPMGSAMDDGMRLQNDLFGNNFVTLRFAQEGHDRGVNWVDFNPNYPLVVSGADDRQIKIWRMNDTKMWELDTLRGHFNNVSCVIFHPRQDLIISNSEDKTIRLWDVSKRTGVQTFRREHDRFWILAAHPELNLFAAGHDSGLIVFKLERERPAYVSHGSNIFYVKERYLRCYDINSGRDVPLIAVRRGTNGSQLNTMPRFISYNPAEKAVLLSCEVDNGTFELYCIPRDGRSSDNVEAKRGLGTCPVFIARNRFAVLDKSHTISIRNTDNEVTKRISITDTSVDMIFGASTGRLLLRSEDKITLFDVQQRKALASIGVVQVKYAVWSGMGDDALVALLSKDVIVIANRKLEQQCIIHETIRIKSGAWNENKVFIYTTLNHMKYCLPNGDNGIIRTLDIPLYLCAVRGNRMYGIDREAKIRIIPVDTTEFVFKLALVQKKYAQVLKMVKESNLIGQSIISYLQQKGFPEVALHFVKDERTRFNLALKCGNLDAAIQSAQALDDESTWRQLSSAALDQGNLVVEKAYQRTKDFDKLSFLYLITGNVEKLRKMLKIAELRNDVMSRFHNSLYLGDASERVRILEEAGLVPLAYLTAKTHGLTEAADRLETKLPENMSIDTKPGMLLAPPTPILRTPEENWPRLTVSRGLFDGGILEEEALADSAAADLEDVESGAWGEEELLIGSDAEEEEQGEKLATAEDEGGEGWGDEALEGLEDIDAGPIHPKARPGEEAFFVPPPPGPSISQIWCKNSVLPADHIAAGSFESAMQLLNQQMGAVHFEPLKDHFMKLYSASRVSLAGVVGTPNMVAGLYRNALDARREDSLPVTLLDLSNLITKLKNAYKLVTGGGFTAAKKEFLDIMYSIPFLVVDTKQASNEAKELLGLCREYINGIRMELHRKEIGTKDVGRYIELAAYFTHCNLQPIHLMLALKSAMIASHKAKNYSHAAGFARRLLELNPKPDIATTARKVIKFARSNDTTAHNLNYDERNPFVVCAKSFSPIYRGSPQVQCPFCGSSFLPEFKDTVCPCCQVGKVGATAEGLQVLLSTRR